jgi:plastocyanin
MATQQVQVQGMSFTPKNISVHVGDTVEWIWGDDNHSVTADDGSFDSTVLNTGASFPQTFTAAGSYPYYCVNHGGPGGQGMSGTVTVA